MNQEPQQNSDTDARRRAVRRTAIVLVLIAVAIYLGFILSGVLRAA